MKKAGTGSYFPESKIGRWGKICWVSFFKITMTLVILIIIVPCEWLRGEAASNRDQIRGRGGLWVDTEERPRATKSVGHGLVNLRPTFGQNTPETSEET